MFLQKSREKTGLLKVPSMRSGRRPSDVAAENIHHRRRSISPNKLVLPLINIKRRLSADNGRKEVTLPAINVSPMKINGKKSKDMRKKSSELFILPGFMGMKRKIDMNNLEPLLVPQASSFFRFYLNFSKYQIKYSLDSIARNFCQR